MNWDRVQGNLKQFTGKVKEQWGQLTDDLATGNSSRARSKPGTAMRRTKSRKTSTIG